MVNRSVRSFLCRSRLVLDLVDYIGDEAFVHLAQESIDPDVLIIAFRGISDQAIGMHQAVKSGAVYCTGRHSFGLIDKDA